MDKYFVLVTAVVFGVLTIAVAGGLRYSQTALLFGLIAIALAPIAIHKVSSPSTAIGLMTGLSLFASFPVKKLYGLAEFPQGMLLSAAYLGSLWTIGAGWKRSWN